MEKSGIPHPIIRNPLPTDESHKLVQRSASSYFNDQGTISAWMNNAESQQNNITAIKIALLL